MRIDAFKSAVKLNLITIKYFSDFKIRVNFKYNLKNYEN